MNSNRYNAQAIEGKWQDKWEQDGLYRQVVNVGRKKHYAVTMLPYPSGDLHIGHWFAMAPSDARARFMRMKGFNVLFPMGFDAFGLPAENAAIARNIHPGKWTKANIARMRAQLRRMGTMFDWERSLVTAEPEYYKWSQWFFKRFFEAGLAYRSRAAVDFCPSCNTTLAREQVWGDDRHCERCGTPVVKKDLEQWFFKTTDYADQLLEFDQIDWPERVKTMQSNWIGRSEGAEVIFLTEQEEPINVFTTRPDTLWGATFMVLAPEHPLVDSLTTDGQRSAVAGYREESTQLNDWQRESAERDKTGVFTGSYALNPVNGARIPIWIADYVLMGYGSGAVMAVPAHDERDFQFALKFGLPVIPVIRNPGFSSISFVAATDVDVTFNDQLQIAGIPFQLEGDHTVATVKDGQLAGYVALLQRALQPDCFATVVGSAWEFVFPDRSITLDSAAADREIVRLIGQLATGAAPRTSMELLWSIAAYRHILFHNQVGEMIHSGRFSGTSGQHGRSRVTDWLSEKKIGGATVNYRLRDWLISRQRYWGAPIPIIYCPEHGPVAVPDEELPVLLPNDVEFRPTGESPLKGNSQFMHTSCPQCGRPSIRETDTMDTFMCSSWYQYRYLSPHYDQGPFDPQEAGYWLPVDQYTGGIEHATMHLIYTRFFTKAMRDIGLIDFDEPMMALRNQGMVLGADGEKMSKSRGNVVSPDELVDRYGSDTVRAYLMFFARWEQGGPWNYDGIKGPQRFISDVWDLGMMDYSPSDEGGQASRALSRKCHQTIRKVSDDLQGFRFNTAVAALMEFRNVLVAASHDGRVGVDAWRESVDAMLLLLAPIAPYITEELWHRRGGQGSVHLQSWPEWDPELVAEEKVTVIAQVNGKVRARIEVDAGLDDDSIRDVALQSEAVQNWIAGKQVRKVIVVKGRLVNIVV